MVTSKQLIDVVRQVRVLCTNAKENDSKTQLTVGETSMSQHLKLACKQLELATGMALIQENLGNG